MSINTCKRTHENCHYDRNYKNCQATHSHSRFESCQYLGSDHGTLTALASMQHVILISSRLDSEIGCRHSFDRNYLPPLHRLWQLL